MPTNVGLAIKEARERLGWTQQDLASRAHMAEKTVSVAENGGSVRRNTIRRLAEVVGLNADELLAHPEEAVS